MSINSVSLMKDPFGRWIIVRRSRYSSVGWSGSRWVPINSAFMPAGSVQVSNFATREEATAYAATFGFSVEEVS